MQLSPRGRRRGVAARALLPVVAALLLPIPAAKSAEEPAFGRWRTDDGAAIIRVGRCGAMLCGTIERVLRPNAPVTDALNPDPARRTRPLVGTTVLSGFSGGGAAWKGGRVYDPESGNTYRAQVQVLDAGRLKVSGCVAVICRSKVWVRVAD